MFEELAGGPPPMIRPPEHHILPAVEARIDGVRSMPRFLTEVAGAQLVAL